MNHPTIEDLRIIYNLPSLGLPASRLDLLAALGFVEDCEECEGVGRELDEISAAAVARAIGVKKVVNDPCPSCGGLGFQVAPELVELVYQTNPAAGRENAEQLLRQVLEKEERSERAK